MKLFELWVDLENLLPSFYFRLPYKYGLIHVVRGVLKLYYHARAEGIVLPVIAVHYSKKVSSCFGRAHCRFDRYMLDQLFCRALSEWCARKVQIIKIPQTLKPFSLFA